MPEESPPQKPAVATVLENMFAPEIFASEASFFSLAPGLVTITFTSYRFDHTNLPGVQRKVVVGRLVLPATGAQALAAGLYDYLSKNGLTPIPIPAPGKIQ